MFTKSGEVNYISAYNLTENTQCQDYKTPNSTSVECHGGCSQSSEIASANAGYETKRSGLVISSPCDDKLLKISKPGDVHLKNGNNKRTTSQDPVRMKYST